MIQTLASHFALATITFNNCYVCEPETALCVVLYRLAAPCRYKTMMGPFNRSRSWLSTIFNNCIEFLVNRYREKLYWDHERLTYEQLKIYSTAVAHKGGVNGIWGFIDGTMRAICRPLANQYWYYSGYKKCHALKYQAAITPDGLISHLVGPYMGSWGDWEVYNHANLDLVLRNLYHNQERLYLYGDPAYYLSYRVIPPYKALPGVPLNPVLQEINAHMSSLRISIEHGFGQTMMLWSFNSFRTGLKIRLSPVAAYFLISVLFSNIHTCLYGNQTSQKFQCIPPTIDEYLHLSPAVHNLQ